MTVLLITFGYVGESVSSDTSIGYNNEVDITLAPWQACEENPDVNIPADICVDPDACQWLHLSPSGVTNLTGMYAQGSVLCVCVVVCITHTCTHHRYVHPCMVS